MKRKSLFLLTFIIVFFLTESSSLAYPTGWTNDLLVSTRARNAANPDAFVDKKGNVHIVWSENNDDIYYAMVDESGSLVVAKTLLTRNTPSDSRESSFPVIASDHYGDIWVVWQDLRDGAYELYFTRSIDNGATWALDTRLTANDGFHSSHPRCAAKSYGATGRFYVTWQDRRTGNHEIFLRSISYDPQSAILDMGTDIQVTPTDGFESTMPDINAYKDWIFITWNDMRHGVNEIYFRKSNDTGRTFSAELLVSENDGFLSQNSRIASNDSGIYIGWEDFRENNFEVYIKKLEHNLLTTRTLIDPQRLSTRDIYDSKAITIACGPVNVYVAWQDEANGNQPEIHYSVSTNDGISYSRPLELTSYAEGGAQPKILTKNENVHLVWQRKYCNNYEIYYKGTIVRLLKTEPAMGATGVQLNASIRMEFSKMMNANLLRNNIFVYGDNQIVQGTVNFLNYDQQTGTVSRVEFVPASTLRPGTLYTVRISKNAKDKNGYSLLGNAMGGFQGIDQDDFLWSFSTADHSRNAALVRNVVNCPNPFGASGTYFTYTIDTDQPVGDVTIGIYSMSGRKIRVLENCSNRANAVNQQYWDGLDEDGNPLANGVYLYKIWVEIGNDIHTGRGKMIVMHEKNLN